MTFSDYIVLVSKYIKYEFDDYGKNVKLKSSEQKVLNGLISYHYDNQDSINNTAADVVSFLKFVVDK